MVIGSLVAFAALIASWIILPGGRSDVQESIPAVAGRALAPTK